MHNDIQIGPITIHMYGIMIAIGFLMAYLVSEYRAKKKGLKKDFIYDILICAIVGGMIGTRLLFYIVSIPDIIKDPSILWNFSNGYVVYGGIIGGILASMIWCRFRKMNFLEYFDLIMPQVAMAQGFGRIGCFFAGCCYGAETDLPIGITYHTSNFAPNGVKLLPTQLISSAGDFGIMALLLLYGKKERKDGQIGAMYMMLYSVGRFVIEIFRNDFRGSIVGLSTSQFISIGVFIAGAVLHFYWGKKHRKNNL